MTIYLLVFVISLIYYYVAKKVRGINSSLLLALYFSYLAIFIGLGDMIGGYDRYIYGEIFDSIADETRGRQDYKQLLFLINGKEYGYYIWNIIVSMITANRYVFILLTSVLMYTLYFRAFKTYVDNYPLAAIVFLGLFYYFTITYIRQAIAVGIIWQSIKYVYHKKPIPFFLCVLLAYLFHSSAAIFGLMYFIPIKKYSKQRIIIILVICLLIGASPISQFLLRFTGDSTGMGGRTAVYAEEEIGGIRFDYILEVIVFLWFIFKFYNNIASDKKSLTFLNMTIAFCSVLFIFIRFGQGGRLGWYFLLGCIYIFTQIANKAKTNGLVTSFIIFLHFILFFRITSAWAFNLTPYKTFLEDGVPSGAYYIYNKWEYDRTYTKDKLYRKPFDPILIRFQK